MRTRSRHAFALVIPVTLLASLALMAPLARRWATRFGVGYRVLGAVPTNISHGDVLVETGIVFRPGRISARKDRS